MAADAFAWGDVLAPLMRREDLPTATVEEAMAAILRGEATDAQIGAFGTLLRAKGETPSELAALVRTMLSFAPEVPPVAGTRPLIDTCGTGGDRSHTVNISTIASLVIAGSGVRVAKHGNRAASSSSGSADLFEELGVAIDLSPEGVVQCIDETGIGFFFAQRFHSALRFVGPARREVGVPTTFNFLGPLANPAHVTRQVIGVSDPAMADRMVQTLAELGRERAMVFFGHDGLDELTTTDVSTLRELRGGSISRAVIEPLDYGIPRATAESLRGGSPSENAAIARKVLGGEAGPARDVVVLNAAAALVVADAAADLAEGVEQAEASIDSGRAAATLDALVKVSRAAQTSEAG
jgi:anthranilate phosphoribosyltransferase